MNYLKKATIIALATAISSQSALLINASKHKKLKVALRLQLQAS